MQVLCFSMQLIDQNDPRPAYVQVAASIRAAILSGELSPGEKLPSIAELAQTFSAATVTISSAMRVLRTDGFIDTRPGAGMWVRSQAALPVDGQHPLTGVASYAYEAGFLKNMPRTGWLMLGIPKPESVAEHSFRAALISIAVATMEGADTGHTAALAIMHDTAETRIGDIAMAQRPYLTAERPEAIVRHQTGAMPDDVAEVYQALVTEFEDGKTAEAKCAKDSDKLELLVTAREYAAQGYDTTGWQQTSSEALRTKSGKLLGQAIMNTSPAEWWKAFADSYHEIKATAKKRAPRQS